MNATEKTFQPLEAKKAHAFGQNSVGSKILESRESGGGRIKNKTNKPRLQGEKFEHFREHFQNESDESPIYN